MKILISETQLLQLSEKLKKSDLPAEERYEIVADAIIKYMDKFKLKTIPLYRFLQTVKTEREIGYNMKTFLAKYLNRGEYDGYVKPLILQKRSDFTYTEDRKLGANNYLVDNGVAVKSFGEVITYNTFKMNGIILKYEDPSKDFVYLKHTDQNIVSKKRPDFYWEDNDLFIEVAGFDDQSNLGVDYELKLQRAKEEVEKMGHDMIILDYLEYKNNLEGFYEMVCKTFNFNYEPDTFWLSIYYEGIDKEKYKEQVKNLIKKGKRKSRGEQDMLNKIIKRYLTKTEKQPDGEITQVNYSGVVDYKRDTGLGMKWSDEEEKNKIKKAWRQSTGSNQKTYEKYKELFPSDKISKLRIEISKEKFPEEFNITKKDIICKNEI